MSPNTRLSNNGPSALARKCADVAVIIRSVHERTEALCESLVAAQVPPDRIVVIHEYPFNESLRKGFEIGLDYDLPWTMYVDADVLIHPTAVSDLLAAASVADNTLFGLQGRILDKFIGGPWDGGPRLYRTSLLRLARPEIPLPGTSGRPESYIHRQMEAKRYGWIQLQTVTGLHDYEQYYSDILRKMILRANKSPGMVSCLLERSRSYLAEDMDFRVANWGLLIGLTTGSSGDGLDARTGQSQASAILCAHGIQEKGPIAAEKYTSFVEKTMVEYVPSESYKAFAEARLATNQRRTKTSPKPRSFKYVPWLTGKALGRISRSLVEWATK